MLSNEIPLWNCRFDTDLKSDDCHIIKWWVYRIFSVHPETKSHIGEMTTLGKGDAYNE